MKLNKIRILNYKGFRDSRRIKLSPNFTVIVGKNNSGKSALLQSFRFQRAGEKAHRSPLIAENITVDQISVFETEATFDWSEIEELCSKYVGGQIHFPVDRTETDNTPDLGENWTGLVSKRPIVLELRCQTNQGYASAVKWPSRGQFADPTPQAQLTMNLSYQPQDGRWIFGGVTGNAENLALIASHGLERQIFVFDAERLSIDMSPPDAGQILSPRAENPRRCCISFKPIHHAGKGL